jgi:hypothetical protein
VTNPGTGLYCITFGPNINPATAVLVVGADRAGGTLLDTNDAEVPLVMWDSGANCGSQSLAVRTYEYNGDTQDDNTLSVNVVGDIMNSRNQSFTFVVP